MAKVGYVRVSTAEQNTARQDTLMEHLGADKVFVDKVSGRKAARPQLDAMLNYVREGDILVVESISRLARSTRDLLDIVEKLTAKGVQFVSQKEQIDTTTPAGQFMLTVFAALSEFEVNQQALRRDEGIAEAKRLGKYKGRKPIEVDEELFEKEYRDWKNGNTAPKFMMKRLNLKPATFWRRVKDYEIRHGVRKESSQ